MSDCGGECPCLWEVSTRVFRGEVSYCSRPPFGWLGRRKCLNISMERRSRCNKMANGWCLQVRGRPMFIVLFFNFCVGLDFFRSKNDIIYGSHWKKIFFPSTFHASCPPTLSYPPRK